MTGCPSSPFHWHVLARARRPIAPLRGRPVCGLGLVVVILSLASSLYGVDWWYCFNYYGYLKWVGRLDTPGNASDIEIAGGHAYVADLFSGLQIVDITGPEPPQIVSSIPITNGAMGVAVEGDHAFVVDAAARLHVVDVTDPAEPEVVSSVDVEGSAYGVVIAGHYAYMAAGYAGVQIIDITDVSDPRLVATVNTPVSAMGVTISGSYIYVADGTSGLQVIDITDPATAQIVGGLNTPGEALNTEIVGAYAYIADSGTGLVVADITIPQSPVIVAVVPMPGNARDMVLSPAFLYVGDSTGLHLVDVTAPGSPELVDSYGLTDDVTSVAVVGDLVFAAVDVRGIEIIETTDPVPSASLDLPGTAAGVSVQGDYTYLACGDAGLCVVDVSNYLDPRLVGTGIVPGNAVDVAVVGPYAYVAASESGLQVVDVSDPASPQHVGGVDTPGSACAVAIAGTIAHVADGVGGLLLVDVADPVHPAIVGGVDTPGSAQGVYVLNSRNKTYVADGVSGVQVVDIVDPGNPVIVDVIETLDDAVGITFTSTHGILGYLYVAEGVGGIQVFRVMADGQVTPQAIGGLASPGGARNLCISGPYGYIAEGPAGIQVCQYYQQGLQSVRLVDEIAEALDVIANNRNVYVACGTAGLTVLPQQCSGEGVPVVLSTFTAAVSEPDAGDSEVQGAPPRRPRAVDLAWSLAEPIDAISLRLSAESAGDSWDVSFLPGPLGAPDMSYVARDDSPLLAGAPSVRYTLLHAASPGAWAALGDVTVVFGSSSTPGALVPQLHVYPNPFNPSTQVSYEMARPGTARVTVHALTGALVRVLADGPQAAGVHYAVWDGRDERGREMSAGGYVVRIATEAGTGAVKVVLVR